MNPLIVVAGGLLVAFGILNKSESKKPESKKSENKVLTPESEIDTVAVPNANSVPTTHEIETQTTDPGDCDSSDRGDAV